MQSDMQVLVLLLRVFGGLDGGGRDGMPSLVFGPGFGKHEAKQDTMQMRCRYVTWSWSRVEVGQFRFVSYPFFPALRCVALRLAQVRTFIFPVPQATV
ncbi:hypothetical protein BKA67DRAFT_146195 [Truncatella angustata]|uniref:Secreted protein n=1 Tax=Truncatella angustata TaxID=152316 RepID=A0A9P8UA39_9PEZI|nr:uncharacterized protein BKA67DRAFT_146195 [Truncatella angustata]KAH6638659.1 hypothetical protein BKA67DRAFT_146195 [Truncatella angustata]